MVEVIGLILLNTLNMGSGTIAEFPQTIITAMVSPTALPIPSIIAADIPDMAAGVTTFIVVSHLVAPMAMDASL